MLGSIVDYVSANLSAHMAVNHALSDVQNMCAQTKVGTVLNWNFQRGVGGLRNNIPSMGRKGYFLEVCINIIIRK